MADVRRLVDDALAMRRLDVVATAEAIVMAFGGDTK